MAEFRSSRWGGLEDAPGKLERAIEIRPDYAAAHTHRGNALYALNRRDEALQP